MVLLISAVVRFFSLLCIQRTKIRRKTTAVNDHIRAPRKSCQLGYATTSAYCMTNNGAIRFLRPNSRRWQALSLYQRHTIRQRRGGEGAANHVRTEDLPKHL